MFRIRTYQSVLCNIYVYDLRLSLLHFGSSLCLAGRNFNRQAIHLERLVYHLTLVVILRARSETTWVVNKGRYVRAWGALVRRGSVRSRTKESAPIFNKTELSTGRIVRIVRQIIYAYAATVDGRWFLENGFPSLSVLVFAQNGKRGLQEGPW